MSDERLIFGIDLGIGSCGWAVLESSSERDRPVKIKGLGSWCFDVPETSKERTPTNQIRRGHRLLRRVIRRRRTRMAEIRKLFYKYALLPSADRDALKCPGLDPWELRAKGLDRPLSPMEFSVALGHIAKRRGFQSSAKRKSSNASSEDKKMLSALEKTQERLAAYRTAGEMFATDPDFSLRRRNRGGVFDRTCRREDLRNEVDRLFEQQRNLGQPFATTQLQEEFKKIAFHQLPMQDSEGLVGYCCFERFEKRCARLAPSYEQFRLLTRLINLRIKTGENERALTPEELTKVSADASKGAKLSATRVCKLIGLKTEETFTTIKKEDGKNDIVAPTGEAMAGSHALRKVLGDELWAKMQTCPDRLDEIAYVLSFFETNAKIEEELSKINLDPEVLQRLQQGLEEEKFSKFKRAGHISSKACRTLLPYLEQGYRYDEACQKVGYDHAASNLSHNDQILNKKQFNNLMQDLGETIANPIARKSMYEGLKQLWAMRNHYGLPDAIHIELARDVGNSLEKRRKLEKQVKDNTAQRNQERGEVQELLTLDEVPGDTLLRYRLWKEQGGRCLYSDQPIPIEKLVASDNSVQLDHILPWSRFGDDSFHNKTLCFAGENQSKKGRTPHEWFQAEKPEQWEVFVKRIETKKELRGVKKRNFLLKNAKEVEEKFRSRNLNDTRYATRMLAEAVKLFYPKGERGHEKGSKRRIFTRAGALTAVLRKAWGVESLKKEGDKRIRDDRHHALDALIIAAVSEGEVQRLTKSFQEWECQGLGRSLRYVDPPWEGFRADVSKAYENIVVARPERHRARGEGHQATIRQAKERDGKSILFERKAIGDLKAADLERIKDPERNKRLKEILQSWIASGKSKDQLPCSPQGDEIHKVRLEVTEKPAVAIRGGSAGRGEMVRVDVFSKPNNGHKNQWFLVPIYPHQVMNKKLWPKPPSQAVAASKDEKDWPQIDTGYKFCFSLYPRSYVEVTKENGEVIEGYFAGLDRSTGAINLASRNDLTSIVKGLGARNLLTIKKYTIDRFGGCFEVKSEKQTWHGKACTFLDPQV